LVYAGEEVDPGNPCGEHPWDDLRSGPNHQPPEPPNVIIFPYGDFGGWIIVHFSEVKNESVDKSQVQTHPSEKTKGKFFILF
jgi:hypothetical protein